MTEWAETGMRWLAITIIVKTVHNGIVVLMAAQLTFNQPGEGSNPSGPTNSEVH